MCGSACPLSACAHSALEKFVESSPTQHVDCLQKGDLPIHVLLETWRRLTLKRLGVLADDPVDMLASAFTSKRLIRFALLDDENPFPDGDPMPWFGPLSSALSYFLDLHPECVAKRNRVCLCLLLHVML